MKASIYRAEGMTGRLPVMLALWMLIAVALLSALAPLGPPLSRVTGSAFNPATSDVVLKARAAATPQAVQAHRPGGDGPPAIALLLPVLAIVMGALWHLRPSPGVAPAAMPRPSRTSGSPGQPRAPPILS